MTKNIKNIAAFNLSLINGLVTDDTIKSGVYNNAPVKVEELASANITRKGRIFEEIGVDIIKQYTGETFYRETEQNDRRQVDLRNEDDLCISVKSSSVKLRSDGQQFFSFDDLEVDKNREEEIILFLGLLPTKPYLSVWTIPVDFLRDNINSLQGLIKSNNEAQLRVPISPNKVRKHGKIMNWLNEYEGYENMARLIKTYVKLYKTDI